MGDGRDVFDHAHIQTGGLQCADGGLTACARTLNEDLYGLHAMLHRDTGCRFGCRLRGEGSGFSRPTEAQLSRAGPGHCIALRIGDRYDGIVECRLDMGCAALNILAPVSYTHLTLPTTERV